MLTDFATLEISYERIWLSAKLIAGRLGQFDSSKLPDLEQVVDFTLAGKTPNLIAIVDGNSD